VTYQIVKVPLLIISGVVGVVVVASMLRSSQSSSHRLAARNSVAPKHISR
jgi:uncharacterized protein YacL